MNEKYIVFSICDLHQIIVEKDFQDRLKYLNVTIQAIKVNTTLFLRIQFFF